MFKYKYELVKLGKTCETLVWHIQLMGCTCTHRYNLSMNDKIITIQLTRSWGNKNILYVKHVRKPLSLRRQTWYSSVSLISRSPLLILNYTLKGLGAKYIFCRLTNIVFRSISFNPVPICSNSRTLAPVSHPHTYYR